MKCISSMYGSQSGVDWLPSREVEVIVHCSIPLVATPTAAVVEVSLKPFPEASAEHSCTGGTDEGSEQSYIIDLVSWSVVRLVSWIAHSLTVIFAVDALPVSRGWSVCRFKHGKCSFLLWFTLVTRHASIIRACTHIVPLQHPATG